MIQVIFLGPKYIIDVRYCLRHELSHDPSWLIIRSKRQLKSGSTFTHCGGDEIDADDILKRIFLNKGAEFRLKCYWSFFPGVQLTIF